MKVPRRKRRIAKTRGRAYWCRSFFQQKNEPTLIIFKKGGKNCIATSRGSQFDESELDITHPERRGWAAQSNYKESAPKAKKSTRQD